jgi:SAM-dependent methyltransferase/chorismate mutase
VSDKFKDRIKKLGQRILMVDRLLVHLIARRNHLAAEVAMIKIEDNQPSYNKEREAKRLSDVANWAEEEGVDPFFAQSMLYSLIGESCKTQLKVVDKYRMGEEVEHFNPTYREMRYNLLELTRMWSEIYDESYGSDHPTTRALINFERNTVDKMIQDLPDRDLVIDLGCATGRELRRIAGQFNQLHGLDISPDMIRSGKSVLKKEEVENVELEVYDIEKILPFDDNSVSMVIMNCGTGSDIRNITFVLSEIKRVLKKEGRFLISFYNKDAWTQRVFMPWPLSGIASVDPDRECLEVSFKERRIPIFAKPYSLDEAVDMLPSGLVPVQHSTYPALSSILPKEVIESTGEDIVNRLDGIINSEVTGLGSYVVIAGRKT